MKFVRLFILITAIGFLTTLSFDSSSAQNRMWQYNSNDKTNTTQNNSNTTGTTNGNLNENIPPVPDDKNMSDVSEFESTKEPDKIDYK